jgi:beta-N-acetylhexosaminidase
VIERLAWSCLLPGFAGLAPPDWVRRAADAGLGGVVLFARNVRDRGQVAELTGALRAERPDLLVAIDEEGGDVTRLEAAKGSSYPGHLALGAADDVGLTARVAGAIAAELAAAGITMNLAPVADVNTNPANPIVGVRAFGSDPERVARHVAAFVEGTQRAGVAACAKHFPGHGDTSEDSHLGLPTVEADRVALLAGPLVPFRAAIEAGTRAIMTAHIRLPALDDAPATLSRAVLHGLLRGELGFDGLIVTDALEMAAVSATVGVEEGAVRALAAGADALCLGHDLAPGRVHAAIVGAVRTGALAEERLAEAADRVRRAGEWAAGAGPAAEVDGSIGLAAARRALRVEGEPVLGDDPLVVELSVEPSIAAGRSGRGLGAALQQLGAAPEIVRVHDVSELPAEGNGRPVVLVLRDAHRHEWQRAAAEALVARGGRLVVVEVGLPAWRPPRAPAYLATYGAGRASLEAAAERLLGR